jgi:hypothetical protein
VARRSERSRQLTAQRWAQKQAAATTYRARAMVLMEMARAFVDDDDPLWTDLVTVLQRRMEQVRL